MRFINQTLSTILFAVSLTVVPASLQAEDLIDHSNNVFNFQHKLAMNGNVHAQFKLATMYETGDGVKTDIEQAKNWYTKASAAGSAPATQRLNYLEVKQQGYIPSKHKQWLETVKKDAAAHNADSTYLLAQLYRQGIGVKKDLNKSLELYDQVAILGSADVEKEITQVQAEIKKAREDKVAEKMKREQEQARQLAAKQAEEKNKQQEKVKQAEAKKLELEEKRRRYEAVMLKIKKEQEMINQQQAKVTGKEVANIDDEF